MLTGLILLTLFSWPGEEEQFEIQPVVADAAGQESWEKPKLVQDETSVLADISLSELRNPFSLRHEKREEGNLDTGMKTGQPAVSRNGLAEQRTAGNRRGPRPSGTPAAPQQRPSAEAASAVNLRGIFYGEAGRFAILAAGSQSSSLAEGESFAGWQIQKIEQQGVLLLGPQGEQYLRLIHSERHAN